MTTAADRSLLSLVKTAMPFLEQNRPEKVKEIYRALERDHPDMPAEEKARIAARQGKPGKQKKGPPYKGAIKNKEKKATLEKTAYMEVPPEGRQLVHGAMMHMLSILLAQYLLYYQCHWKSEGTGYYGDHELFSKLYGKVQGEVDAIAEKIIGYHGTAALDINAVMQTVVELLGSWTQEPSLFAQGLSAERMLQDVFKQIYEQLKQNDIMPLGLDDWIMGVANDHETHTYLLQQRLTQPMQVGQAPAAKPAGPAVKTAADPNAWNASVNPPKTTGQRRQNVGRPSPVSIPITSQTQKDRTQVATHNWSSVQPARSLKNWGARNGYMSSGSPVPARVGAPLTKEGHSIFEGKSDATMEAFNRELDSIKLAFLSIPAGAITGAISGGEDKRWLGAGVGALGGVGGAIAAGIPVGILALLSGKRGGGNHISPEALKALLYAAEVGGGAGGGYLAGRAVRKKELKKTSSIRGELTERVARPLAERFQKWVGGQSLTPFQKFHTSKAALSGAVAAKTPGMTGEGFRKLMSKGLGRKPSPAEVVGIRKAPLRQQLGMTQEALEKYKDISKGMGPLKPLKE